MPQDDATQVSDRLAFEREKWQSEQELEQRKLTLMEREQLNRDSDLDLRRREQVRSRWSNPLVLSILAAALAAGSNAAVTLLNGYLQRNNEEAKAESTRILEMIKTDDPDHAARNLEFLVKAGLVTEPGRLAHLKLFLDSRKPGEGPSLPASTPQFHFERSEYLTSSDQNRIQADLAEFVKYLSGVGFPVDAVPPWVRVDKSVEPGRPAYYSSRENLISLDPRLKGDLSLA
jgi:hypothetical protein